MVTGSNLEPVSPRMAFEFTYIDWHKNKGALANLDERPQNVEACVFVLMLLEEKGVFRYLPPYAAPDLVGRTLEQARALRHPLRRGEEVAPERLEEFRRDCLRFYPYVDGFMTKEHDRWNELEERGNARVGFGGCGAVVASVVLALPLSTGIFLMIAGWMK